MREWIITASTLIGIVIGLRALLKGKISLRLQYALWVLVLIRLLVPVNFFSSSFSVLNLTEKLPAAAAQAPVSDPQITPAETVPPVEITQPVTTPSPVIPGTVLQEKPSAEPPWEYPFTLAQTLTFVWLLGITVSAAVVIGSNLRFASRLKRSRTAVQIDCRLPVFYSAVVESPCLFGLFRPVIYLPLSCKDDPKVLSHVLAHELAHYGHRDHIWAVCRCICLCLHWYNPLVWAAAVLSRQDAELACDEAAIRALGQEQRTDYGKTLIGLSCAKPGAARLLNTATTMDSGKRSLKERIVLIAKHPRTTFITLICVIVAAAIALALTFTGARQALSDTGRLVYYNGNLYAVQQAPSKLYTGYPYVQEDSGSDSYGLTSVTHPPLVGTIQKCNKNRIPYHQLSSNYFPEGTEVYAWDDDSQLLYVQVPWSEDNSYFTLTKTTPYEIQEKPVLTMGDLQALVSTYRGNLSFQHLEPYRSYEKSSSYYQLFFEIGDSDHSLSVSDYEGDGIADDMQLYAFQRGTGIDPRYVEIEDFLAMEPTPKPEAPVYDDGGIEGCFLFINNKLYVWEYYTEAPVPTSGNARRSGEVASNDIYSIPSSDGAACRLEPGTKLYRDTVYDCYYTQPGPIGSDLEYAKFVPARDMEQWWQESQLQPGYYTHSENGNMRDGLYLYFDGKGNGAYIAGGLESAASAKDSTMTVSRKYSIDYRIDGDVLSTSRGTYLYLGTEKPQLPQSDPLTSGQYTLGLELGDSEGIFLSTDFMHLNSDGTGTLTFEDKQYPVRWGDDGLYVDSKLTLHYFDSSRSKGTMLLQLETGKAIISFYRSIAYTDAGELDTSVEALTKYRMLFAPTDDGMDYSRTLSSVYERYGMDLYRLFYNGFADNPEPNSQELEYLISQGFDPALGIGRITQQQLEGTLEKYFGAHMGECDLAGLRSFTYYNGSYFFNHTANEQITVEILGVFNSESQCPTVLYYYTGESMAQYQGVVMEVMLEAQDDGSMIVVSNKPTDYMMPQ